MLSSNVLRNLKFRYKLLLLPALAAVGFVVVLLVSFIYGRRNQRLLALVENGYYPAVSVSRSLNETLSQIQRGLQDGVARFTVRA